MTNKEKLIRQLADKIIKDDNIHDAINILSEAYDAGFKAKKCKEDKDDYHIDPKRQTKLDF